MTTTVPELDVAATLQDVAEQIKRTHYVDGYAASDAEALGVALAIWSSFDGAEILRAAESGLEDANFHTESAIVGRMAGHVEAGEPQPGEG